MKYYGGIDLGGTNSKIGLLNENGDIIFSVSVKTEQVSNHNVTIEKINKVFREECLNNSINYDDVLAIGIGVPGPVINKSTVLMWANFPWKDNLNLSKEFEKVMKRPVYLDNDVNVIALGELWKGSGLGYTSSLTIAIGTGIGAGVVINGKIISGKNGAAGEMGHIPIVLENGRICGCGKKGCLEAYASASSIGKIANERLEENKNNLLFKSLGDRRAEAKDVFEMAKLGDDFSISIVDDSCKKIAFGISTAINLLDLDLVIIAGGLSLAGDFLIDNIKKHLKAYMLPSLLKNFEIKIAKLGNDAGIFGAAYLALCESK